MFTQSGFGVRLIDAAPAALDRLATGTTTGAADVDDVIDANFEDAGANRGLFARLDRITKPGVILLNRTGLSEGSF